MKYFISAAASMAVLFFITNTVPAEASYHFSDYKGRPPIHVFGSTTKVPRGITPAQIKKIYNLPATGGKGTIIIVGAYNDTTLEADLATFDRQFGLVPCTTANRCFAKHPMSASVKSNSGWAMETSLDVEWAHAIAPGAKILVIEARTPSGANLLKAVDYAARVSGASAISMSWGGGEFPEETSLDSHFVSKGGAPFFASSGDRGAGAGWPASSPNVIGVGGTSLSLSAGGVFKQESAWSGSGGGVSAYEKEPTYQRGYSIAKTTGMRAIPDVAYDADPKSGFSIVLKGKWYTVGGTSAGAPQWAAIASLGSGATNANFYSDKAGSNSSAYFRDIVFGDNGACSYYCVARKHYDYVTGLGSPLTVKF